MTHCDYCDIKIHGIRFHCSECDKYFYISAFLVFKNLNPAAQ